jgi:hypothetical protein
MHVRLTLSFLLQLNAPEDGNIRVKHVGLHDYFVKKLDGPDGTFAFNVMYTVHR